MSHIFDFVRKHRTTLLNFYFAQCDDDEAGHAAGLDYYAYRSYIYTHTIVAHEGYMYLKLIEVA